jgi:stringent starvation protein B
MAEVSTKPYLIRAIYDWCTDCGFTPYVAVAVDETVRVPAEFVRNGEIVLNVSALATSRLLIDNDAISFQARFGGVPREVHVPMARVIAVYARENGQGMAFEVPKAMSLPAPQAVEGAAQAVPPPEPSVPPEPPKPSAERPKLTRVK